MLALPLLTLLFSVATASPVQLIERQDTSGFISCLSLRTACNGNNTNLENVFNNTACVLMATCIYPTESVTYTITSIGANATSAGASAQQPRLSEDTFKQLTGGSLTITQQNYIDAFYGQISNTVNGTYPTSATPVEQWFSNIAAWTGNCSSLEIPYNNFADFLEYSSAPGVCPAVASCDASIAATARPCIPQPASDNGSCNEVVAQCQLWVTGGLFQNEYCVLASMCYAEASTDDLIEIEYPSYVPVSDKPTSLTSARLSESVFQSMTKDASTMSLQNVIDAYYGALTGTWESLGGPFGAETPQKTDTNGPYPTSTSYVENFWTIISAWTGFCDTKEIPYSNLADYLTYAATSNYHPTC